MPGNEPLDSGAEAGRIYSELLPEVLYIKGTVKEIKSEVQAIGILSRCNQIDIAKLQVAQETQKVDAQREDRRSSAMEVGLKGVRDDIQKVELSLAKLFGIAAGSATIGGLAGAIVDLIKSTA